MIPGAGPLSSCAPGWLCDGRLVTDPEYWAGNANVPHTNSILYCIDEWGARGGPVAGSNKRPHTQPAARIQHSNLKKEFVDITVCTSILLHLLRQQSCETVPIHSAAGCLERGKSWC